MNEINAALRMREAAVQKAEASKITVVKAAEADAEAKFLAGEGMLHPPLTVCAVDSHLLQHRCIACALC